MNTGKITIEDLNDGKFVVQLVNGDLWLTNYEIARLFNVHINAISSNIRSILKARLLLEQDVCKEYPYIKNGKNYISKLYNFEMLLFLAYRVDSCEVRAFREWLQTTIIKYIKMENCNSLLSHINMVLPGNIILN